MKLQPEAAPQHRVQVRRAARAGPVRRAPLPQRRQVQQQQERLLLRKLPFGGRFKRRLLVHVPVAARAVRGAALRARPGPVRLFALPLRRGVLERRAGGRRAVPVRVPPGAERGPLRVRQALQPQPLRERRAL